MNVVVVAKMNYMDSITISSSFGKQKMSFPIWKEEMGDGVCVSTWKFFGSSTQSDYCNGCFLVKVCNCK